MKIYLFLALCITAILECLSMNCTLPNVLKGSWFSIENNENVVTSIENSTITISKNKQTETFTCLNINRNHNSEYTIILKSDAYYKCIKIFVRTINVLEKIQRVSESGQINSDMVCKNINEEKSLYTMFLDDHKRVSCKNSIQGSYTFSYQQSKKFLGECNNPESLLQSCPVFGGYQLLSINDKFTMEYYPCKEIKETFHGRVEFGCLGDWFVGDNQYFAVYNTRESRNEQKYTCFIRNKKYENMLGMSNTSSCNKLFSPIESPEVLRLNSVRTQYKEPGCYLPKNFTGKWSSKDIDVKININLTHVIETVIINNKTVNTVYICKERKDNLIAMEKTTLQGCSNEHVCFDFLPRHQNIIRYKTGIPTVQTDFESICASRLLEKSRQERYSYFVKIDPQPIRCPLRGRFIFSQKGDILLDTIRNGGRSTTTARPGIHCKNRIPQICSGCNNDQNAFLINVNQCKYVDDLGKPVEITGVPDYKLSCVGYWKENEKSYLITYDALDALYQYKCWVYSKDIKSGKILISQALGSTCDDKQHSNSSTSTEGVAVALELNVYDTNSENPIYVDDGINPWV